VSTIIETAGDVQAGLTELLRIDPRLAPIAAQCGELPLRRRAAGFEGLAGIVMAQQVSTASAAAIWARFATRFAPFDPAVLLAATDEDLGACGLSRPKMRTLRAIATAIADGSLPLAALAALPADEIRRILIAVPGIGPWTADVYAMFCVGHADVFAPGDLALQEAARLAFALPARPDARALAALAEPWSPWRAVAARLLWRYYAVAKRRDAMPVLVDGAAP